MSSAIPCSSPVKLCTPTIRLAVSTRRSRSIVSAATSCERLAADVRQHFLAEQADLLVAVVAPELEHHVGAAGVAVLLDRCDAVRRCARDRLALVEEGVRYLSLGGEPPS